MLKNLKKITYNFLLVLFSVSSLEKIVAQEALSKSVASIIVDQDNCRVKGELTFISSPSKLKQVSLVDGGHGSLSKKLVMIFQSLQAFSFTTKRTQAGNIIHNLIFDGLNEQNCDFSALNKSLACMTLDADQVPALKKVSIKPIARASSRGYASRLQVLFQHDPTEVFVKISQGAGEDVVEIEVFDQRRLKQVARANNTTLKYATATSGLRDSFSGNNWLLRL